MKLNKRELRKILYDFNSYSNRLIQANYGDYTGVLQKYLNYLDSTPIIADYIKSCGDCDMNVEEDIKEVQHSYGREIFAPGDTEEEEVRNIYAVLRYIANENIDVYNAIAIGYARSTSKFQERVKAFNDRFVMILIGHIERYLTKVGIDMGLDEKIVYNVSVENGQAIIATDGSTVNATNQVKADLDGLEKLIAAIKENADVLDVDSREAAYESLEVIETESAAEKPKKSMIKTALGTLKAIKGTVEFGASVAALADFIAPLLPM